MDDLLPGRLPLAAPSLPGADDAVARGRRRRRSQEALGAAVLSVVVLAGVALTAGGGDDRQTLQPGVLPSVTAPPTAVSPHPSPLSSAPGFGAASPTPLPSAVASALASAVPGAGSGGPTPTSQPAPSPQRGITNGPEPVVTAFDSSRTCDGSGPSAAGGWCSYYDGATTGRRGSTVTLAASVCRLPNLGPSSLWAENGQYAEYYVGTNDTGTLWDWSKGRRFGSASREFSVQAGTCLRFGVRWDLRGDNGRALPAGTYDLTAYPDVQGAGVYTGLSNVVPFTIT